MFTVTGRHYAVMRDIVFIIGVDWRLNEMTWLQQWCLVNHAHRECSDCLYSCIV